MSTEKKWIEIKALETYPEAEKTEIEQAMQFAVEQVIRNLPEFTEAFPGPNSFGNFYKPGENVEWTTGFWTEKSGFPMKMQRRERREKD